MQGIARLRKLGREVTNVPLGMTAMVKRFMIISIALVMVLGFLLPGSAQAGKGKWRHYGKVPSWGNGYGLCVAVYIKNRRPRHAEFTLQNGRYLEAHYDSLFPSKVRGKRWWKSKYEERGVRLLRRKARVYWQHGEDGAVMALPRISHSRWNRICPGVV